MRATSCWGSVVVCDERWMSFYQRFLQEFECNLDIYRSYNCTKELVEVRKVGKKTVTFRSSDCLSNLSFEGEKLGYLVGN